MADASDARGDAVARVFLSYRREDTGQVVARLAEDLEAELGDGQVFYDRERLQGGDVWRERLKVAIQGAEVVVALIGKGWVQARDAVSGMRRIDDPRDPVRLELETALGEARSRQLRIVPVLVDGAPRPDERSRLSDSIQGITAIHTLPLRTATNDEWKADVERIVTDIGIAGQGRTREDARTAEWVAEHLQRLTARVAQRLAASAPIRSGDPEPRYINLSLVKRPAEERPAEERPAGERSAEERPAEDWSAEERPAEERPAEERAETRPEVLQKVYDLEQLVSQDRARILVLGEGGAGKTTSLLHVAATAAERARVDSATPVPVYVDLALLMQIEDIRDLEQLVADAVPPASEGVSLQHIAARRPCLFLFDAFNEVPEHLHRNCVIALRRFVDTWGDRHRYIVSSRAVPGIEPLEQPPATFAAYHLLRLTAEQVEGYLDALGLAVLHERMPQELRTLACNPFMLVAIARTLRGTAAHDLPRNRGKLYQRVVETWMATEAAKRQLAYSYQRVKVPVLSYLAMRMIAAGQTALSWCEVEPEIEQLLEATYQRIRRLGGMPDNWTVDGCRAEIMADDVLQQAGDRVSFRHQSFQEYFAACWFAASGRADALVRLTPRLVWSLVRTASPVDVSSHRLVPVLTMMVGLVEDSTSLVEALAERNLVTAAAAIASASRVDPAVRAGLEQRWIEMLRDADLGRRGRAVACSCLCQVAMSPAAARALVELALDDAFENARVGAAALPRVSAADELATQIVEAVLAFDEERYRRAERRIKAALRRLSISRIVVVAFEHWRTAHGDDARRSRLEAVLASIDRAMIVARLRHIVADTVDAARAADADYVLANVSRWRRSTKARQIHRQRAFYDVRRDQEAARLKDADIATLEAALAVGDDATRAGAARVIADRRILMSDAIIDALLRVGVDRYRRHLIVAAIELLGAPGVIAKLVEVLQRDRVLLRHLDASAFALLPARWESEADSLAVSIHHQVAIGVAVALGRSDESRNFEVTPSGLDGRSWQVTTHGYVGQRYEVYLSADGLDLYDCSMRVMAIHALTEIGLPALAALRTTYERADSAIQSVAIAGLARLGDPELADRLLELLGRTPDHALVEAALKALLQLRAPRAIVLIEDLFKMTEDGPDVHPRWGVCRSRLGWRFYVHEILVSIGADREVASAIDVALASGDVHRKCVALRELSRWRFIHALGAERSIVWNQARREQLVALALYDPVESVRRKAVSTLWHESSTVVIESVARGLDDGDPRCARCSRTCAARS